MNTSAIEGWSKIIANVATILVLPLLTYLGLKLNNTLQTQQVNAKFLDSALTVLQSSSDTAKPLRPWAVEMIEKFIRVQLDSVTIQKLKKSEIQLPGELAKRLISQAEEEIREEDKRWRASVAGTVLSRKQTGLKETLRESREIMKPESKKE